MEMDDNLKDSLKNDLKAWARQFTDKDIPEGDLERVAETILGRIDEEKP